MLSAKAFEHWAIIVGPLTKPQHLWIMFVDSRAGGIFGCELGSERLRGAVI